MILVDTNLLVYACMPSMPNHKKAKNWLDERLNGSSLVGMPWPSLLGFLRIVTNPRIFSPAVSPEDAWKVVNYWLDCPTVWTPLPTEEHRRVLARIYASTAPQGNLVPDAHLAALAVSAGTGYFRDESHMFHG